MQQCMKLTDTNRSRACSQAAADAAAWQRSRSDRLRAESKKQRRSEENAKKKARNEGKKKVRGSGKIRDRKIMYAVLNVQVTLTF